MLRLFSISRIGIGSNEEPRSHLTILVAPISEDREPEDVAEISDDDE